MAIVKPFPAVRPNQEAASQVAALPYDVYNRKEACQAVEGRPLSFLNIDRAETQFPDEVDTYAAVSYTHLDVYKRQALDEGSRWGNDCGGYVDLQ